MGAGIASMHYIGMTAMRLPAMCHFNSFLVVLSVLFAVLISLAALWITFRFRDEKMGMGREKLAGAVVMGAAIPVMHYTGMAAASFTLVRHAGGPISRRKHLLTWHRRNFRRHFYRTRAGSAYVLG